MCGRRRLGALRGHVENAEGCRAVGVDGVTRLRDLCRRDGHVRRLTECGRGIGLSLIGLGLGPSLFEGQGLGGIGGGIRLDSGIVAGLVLVARHVTRRGLVPLLVRSLALAIPPFKVIDIHTGRPLGLANKHSLVLYPQTAPKLTRAGHENRHNIRRFSSISRFSPNVVTVWATGRQRNVTKRLSLCHILLELQGLNLAYSRDIGVTTLTAATTPKSKSTAAALSPARTNLCLALLVLLGFSLGCSEFVVIGIESDLATELGVSLATAGQLISVFALVYAIATPVLALSTGRFRRYQLLVCYSIVFVLGNLVMALAPNFQVLFISRIILGSVSGALLAAGVTYIPELLSPRQTSLAISVVYGAFSVAMVFVTSIGKFVADTLDWHVAMYGTLAFAVLICGALVMFMPRAGQTDEPATFREQAGLLCEPSIITGMLIFLFGVGSVYVFYGYVTPYLEQMLGMGTVQASTTLMVYGVFCLISNILGGWIDARFGMKALLVTFVLQAAALLGLFAVGGTMPLALVFVFSLALLMYLFSVSCITHFMDVARSRHPKSMVLASSVEPMAFNVGISFGTAVGGAVVSSVGIAYVGAVGAAFSLVAWALTLVTIKLARWERRRG